MKAKFTQVEFRSLAAGDRFYLMDPNVFETAEEWIKLNGRKKVVLRTGDWIVYAAPLDMVWVRVNT